MGMNKWILALLAVTAASGWASADEKLSVEMKQVDASGAGKSLGTIDATQTPYGVLFTPNLAGLPPGTHGFHVHQHPDCGPMAQGGTMSAAVAAGGHLDPANTGRHEGPYGSGHLGDLPAIHVDLNGTATYPMLAPRLKLSDLKGHSLMVHAGGDNYADLPQKLGGGGARIACGVLK